MFELIRDGRFDLVNKTEVVFCEVALFIGLVETVLLNVRLLVPGERGDEKTVSREKFADESEEGAAGVSSKVDVLLMRMVNVIETDIEEREDEPPKAAVSRSRSTPCPTS
jgi:hypothetical protein